MTTDHFHYEVIRTMMARCNATYFIGGSRRFGYHTDASDTDVHVSPEGFDLEEFRRIITVPPASPDFPSVSATLYRFTIIQQRFDVNVYQTVTDYRTSEAEHKEIEDYLAQHPGIAEYIRTSRERLSIHSGIHVYRVLRLAADRSLEP